MDSESDECNRSPGFVFIFIFCIRATLQFAGCYEGSCCVSEITLAFNLTKSLRLKRGSSNWQAAPTDVDTQCMLCVLIWSVWHYAVCIHVCDMGKGWLCTYSRGWYRLDVRLRVYVTAWWHLLYVLPAYPRRFVWQLYDLCANALNDYHSSLSGTVYSTEYTNHPWIDR